MYKPERLTHKMDKDAYREFAGTARKQLLDAQVDLFEQKRKTVLVLINGLDGAGKGETLNLIYDWLDPHYLETMSYGEPTGEERKRPSAWKYWRDMPARGNIGLLVGSWYHDALHSLALGDMSAGEVSAAMSSINKFEAMLHAEGVVLLKIWLEVDEAKAREKRERKARKNDAAVLEPIVREWSDLDTSKKQKRLVDGAREIAELTSPAHAPWQVVRADDVQFRNATVASLLLQTLLRETAALPERSSAAPALLEGRAENVSQHASLLSTLDLTQALDDDQYRIRLVRAQADLADFITHDKRGLVLVFEGNDGAGKGGAINRVRQALDPRTFRVRAIAAPTDEERARPYLWRFWRAVPRRSNAVIFDRSWYGRVLVERIEGFCSETDQLRAYDEINDFEHALYEGGYIVIKFWFAITQEEQLLRFQDREQNPTKHYKITPEDWRNREKWPLYARAADDMLARTNTAHAPWTLVEANDKRFARVKVLESIVSHARSMD